ncbi:MAG TPA: response regulator transcription factor [Microthrixaceae bacterium]|nr:response regulator transcription factor [Microthrixaceae bacterium]
MRAAPTQRVLIIDDHVVLGEVVSTCLGQRGFRTRLCTTGSEAEVLRVADHFRPGVVLLDLGLWPEIGESLHLVGPLAQRGSKVVVLTGTPDRLLHARAVGEGATGVLEKRRPFQDIVDAIEAAFDGNPVNPRWEIDSLLSELRTAEEAERTLLEPFRSLTERESTVLEALMTGMNATDIAAAQIVSLATTRTHIRSILQKLNVHSQLAAVAKARDAGWRSGRDLVAT